MYDSTGLMVQRRDFVELENIQMREMSKAAEITKNIWVKNQYCSVVVVRN